MNNQRIGAFGAWLVGACLALAIGAAQAKSLYLIANINTSPSPIQTYDIQTAPSHVVLQATQTIPSRAGGAVGLAIDTDNKKLFATYEGSNVIQLVNAVNFADLGTTTAPGASNLAGLVVDQGKSKLYAVDRNTNHLYVYTWNSATNTLTLDGGAFVALAGVSSAHGLALDEARGRLYVGDNLSTTVRYYNTSGWGIAGSFALTTVQTPMGITVDSKRNAVFMGNAYGPFGSRGQLVKYDLNTNTESVYTLPGASTGSSSGNNIVGVAVDEDTGNVYATTGNQGSGGTDTLMVFDQNLTVLKSDLGDLGDPTGLAIPRASISFNPLNFSKLASPSPAANGSNLTYTLCYDNLANTVGATGVTITDAIPAGAAYVSATGPATFAANTVTWTIGPVAAGAAQVCYNLVVNVTGAAGTQLFNSATITGTIGPNTIPTSQTVTTDIIGGFKPLSTSMTDSADPAPTGTNVTYTTCVNPGANTNTVNGVQITNPIPTGASFVSASASGTLSGSTVTWSLGNLAPETANVCVDLVLLVSAPAGGQITNTATVTSADTAAQTVSHATDVTSNYKPLALSYDDGVATTPSGRPLTLQVCFDNTANTLPVTGVRIRGLMPDGTTYVSNTGPGTFDGTYITWNVGNVAAGAAQACYTLTVQVVAQAGENISGGMVLTSTEVQPSSAANHTTAVVQGTQAVVIEGQGEGGGGSTGPIELMLGGLVAGLAAWRRRAAVAALAAGAAVAAQAAGPGWYVGVGGGQMNAKSSASTLASDLAALGYTAQTTMDNTDTGWKLFGGYRFNPYLALEGGYVDLGKVKSEIRADVLSPQALVDDVSRVHPFSIKGAGLWGVASYPIGDFSVFGKVGVVRWTAKASARVIPAGTPSASIDDKGTGAAYGLGLGYDVPNTRWSVRGEWEKFNTRRNDPELISLSLMVRF